MAYSGWPSTANVVSALAPLVMPAYVDIAGEIDSAVSDFERDTGYLPFLAEAVDSEVTFTNYLESGREVLFPTGYISVSEFWIDDQEMDLGVDFELSPKNGTPIEGATMLEIRRFAPMSLKVVGKRGYRPVLPSEVWSLILSRACAPAYIASGLSSGSAGFSEIRQGPVTLKVASSEASDGYSGLAGEIAGRWSSVVGKYRRMTF